MGPNMCESFKEHLWWTQLGTVLGTCMENKHHVRGTRSLNPTKKKRKIKFKIFKNHSCVDQSIISGFLSLFQKNQVEWSLGVWLLLVLPNKLALAVSKTEVWIVVVFGDGPLLLLNLLVSLVPLQNNSCLLFCLSFLFSPQFRHNRPSNA